MDAAAWAACLVGTLGLLFVVFLTLLCRSLRNEQIIGGAIVSMRAALTAELPPERALLRDVADAMAAQERVVAKIEADVHEMALRGDPVPPANELLRELLSLPEPQLLVAEFLREHAGGPGSDAAFASAAADMLRTATVQAFKDLADQGLVDLDRLLVIADKGRIADIALASLDSLLDPNPLSQRIPLISGLDPSGMAAVVRALDWTTRRQLRLATLLHGQAEAMLRIPPPGRRGLAALWLRLRALTKFPVPRRPEFRLDDLEKLALGFGAVGEVLDMVRERLAEGKLMQAAHLLAGMRIPSPAGLPARIYLQESLAQVRPLSGFGVWHRLAVCRWAASTLEAIAQRHMAEPDRADSPAESSDAGVHDGVGEP
jgi:hypothetical protein